MSIASCTSPLASASTFPISRVTVRARVSLSRISRSATRKRISPRRGAGMRRHPSKASVAAFIASSMSSGPESTHRPTTSPVAGSRLSKVRPEWAPTHLPPISFSPVSSWQHLFQNRQPLVHFIASDGQRGADPDHVPATREQEEPSPEGLLHGMVALAFRRLLGPPVADQFNADHQAPAAHVPDRPAFLLKLAQPLLDVRALLGGVPHESFLFNNLDGGQPRLAGHRVATEGGRVRAPLPRHDPF